MAEEAEPASPPGALEQAQRSLSLVATVIAPVSLLSALLFYFGYVSSRAQFDYFGLDADTIGLSTRDYVMRSPQPLLAPLLTLVLLAGAAAAAHTAVRAWLAGAPTRATRARRVVLGGGAALLVVALLSIAAYPVAGDLAAYALVIPLGLAAAAALLAYGLGIGAWPRPRGRTLRVLLVAVVVVSVFWATATVAEWSGRGLAKEQARDLRRLPSVVLDSRDRIVVPTGSGVVEHAIGAAADPTAYRFRYTNLRLLVQGPDRMFLVPSDWSPSATTLAVPMDDRVRVQFQFRNDPP